MLQATEDGTSESAGMGDAFEDRTQCMTPERSAFLAHWLRLVDLEEGDQSARRAEIWALPGGQPGSSGRMPSLTTLTHMAGLLSQPDRRNLQRQVSQGK